MERYIPYRERRKRNISSYAELPFYKKRDIANQKDLEELAASGQLADFIRYQNQNKLWENIKSIGSGALDILQRGEYVPVAGVEAAKQGEPVIPAVAKELFSGIGGLQGQKKTWGEYVRETNPDYAQFSEEHPIMATATDLGMSIAGDLTTFIPARAIGKAGSAVYRGIGAVAKKVIPETAKDVIGKTFKAGYAWKKAGAPKGYDIIWKEGKFADALMKRYGKEIEPITNWLRKSASPEQVQEFIRAAKGDIRATDPIVRDMVYKSEEIFNRMGRRDYRYIGKLKYEFSDKTIEKAVKEGKMTLQQAIDEGYAKSPMMKNYLPNRPSEYTDLMTAAGDRTRTGYGKPGGFKNFRSPWEKEQKLRSGEELIDWMKEKGVAPEQMGEAVSRSMTRRAYESMAKARTIRTQTRLVNELPEVFRKLPAGIKTVWNKEVMPGESLWMPAGNLKFFPMEVINKPSLKKILDEGGIITEDDLSELVKNIPGISTKVKVYAVPTEIAEDLNRVSNRLGSDTVIGWWDKMLSAFKNTAILSPGFHIRNFISSAAQNYLAGVNPWKYIEALRVLRTPNIRSGMTPEAIKAAKDANNTIIAGKTVGGWKNLMNQFSITGGSFVGQQTGEATGKLGKIAEPIFSANRAVGSSIEDIHRATLFMDRVSKGIDPLEAAKEVKRFHFDYGELTDFEKVIARRFIPFYAWCVSDDTECLTWYGWRKHNKIAKGDIILTYNIEKKEFEWKPVQDKFEAKYNYKLIHFLSKNMDLLCTFDHNCLTSEGLKKAYQIKYNDRIYQKKPEYLAKIKELLGDDFNESIRYPKPNIVNYNGIIWCPTTENNTWVARRNGKVIVTGNTRKNIPLQLEMLFNAPKKFRNIAKLKEAVSGGQISENQPDWWKNQDVWETRFTDSSGQRQAVSVGLPYADLNQLGRSSVGMMGPFATLYNLAANYDPFYDQKIEEFPGQTRPILTIGNTKLNVPAKIEYAIAGLIPIAKKYGIDLSSEISQIVTRTPQPGTMSKALSKFIGVRVMPLIKEREDKERVYKLMNDLSNYKKYIEQRGGR